MNSNLAFAPPIHSRSAPKSSATTTATSPTSCECARTFNLSCEQGATLSTQITITLNGAPVNVTGGTFQFTAKTDPAISDSDPSTVKINWPETATPTTGITWLVIPASKTITMQPVGYSYQVRFVSSGGVVTPLVKGILTIVQPISSRYT